MDGFLMLMLLEEIRLEEEKVARQRMRIQRREARFNSDPFDIPTVDFIKLYRFPQYVVRNLIEDLRPEMQLAVRTSAIPLESKVLAALSFFASGSFQRCVGQDVKLAMSQSMVSRSVHQVIDAINKNLAHRWIRFPMGQAERDVIKKRIHIVVGSCMVRSKMCGQVRAFCRFSEATGIPGTIGAIDCTHIGIVRPADHQEHYINCKSYHSLNVQVVCDYDMKILNLNPRFAGSSGDACIWRHSTCKQELVRRYAAGERGEWLIGDAGYSNEPWLLLPIENAAADSPEENYTSVLLESHRCVERCFDVLKGRWRCLLRHRMLHYDPHTARKIVMTCAVLHNMAIDAHLPDPDPLTEEEAAAELALEAGDDAPDPIDMDEDYLEDARLVESEVVATLWNQRQ